MTAANELELESELEGESEGELGLSAELEHELELAHELTNEFEMEHEHEAEHEAFFNSLAAMADRGGRSQSLRRIALAAARSALRSQARPWPVVQGEGEFGELEHELEHELELGELEGEHELEFEASPAQMANLLAAMEHEGHAAAEAANEQEAAEHFLPLIGLAAKFVLPKLVGLAAKKLGGAALKKIGGKVIGRVGGQLLRRVAPRLIRRVTPQLTRGLANVTRTLFRNRSTRPLLHAVPRIARTTVARLGSQVASGRRITPQMAARTLAQQTARVLSNPRVLAQTYRQSLAGDRRYHRRARRVLGRPVGAPVRAATAQVSWPTSGVAAGQPGFPPTVVAGAPYGPAVGQGGVVWPAPTTGAFRCMCQPVGAAASTCANCGR